MFCFYVGLEKYGILKLNMSRNPAETFRVVSKLTFFLIRHFLKSLKLTETPASIFSCLPSV